MEKKKSLLIGYINFDQHTPYNINNYTSNGDLICSRSSRLCLVAFDFSKSGSANDKSIRQTELTGESFMIFIFNKCVTAKKPSPPIQCSWTVVKRWMLCMKARDILLTRKPRMRWGDSFSNVASSEKSVFRSDELVFLADRLKLQIGVPYRGVISTNHIHIRTNSLWDLEGVLCCRLIEKIIYTQGTLNRGDIVHWYAIFRNNNWLFRAFLSCGHFVESVIRKKEQIFHEKKIFRINILLFHRMVTRIGHRVIFHCYCAIIFIRLTSL